MTTHIQRGPTTTTFAQDSAGPDHAGASNLSGRASATALKTISSNSSVPLAVRTFPSRPLSRPGGVPPQCRQRLRASGCLETAPVSLGYGPPSPALRRPSRENPGAALPVPPGTFPPAAPIEGLRKMSPLTGFNPSLGPLDDCQVTKKKVGPPSNRGDHHPFVRPPPHNASLTGDRRPEFRTAGGPVSRRRE